MKLPKAQRPEWGRGETQEFEERKKKLTAVKRTCRRKVIWVILINSNARVERDKFVVQLLKFLYGEDLFNTDTKIRMGQARRLHCLDNQIVKNHCPL
jgi:hypothetical protein